jgi:hypothetical protein
MPDEQTTDELHPHLVLEFGDDVGRFRAHEHFNLALLWKHKSAIERGTYEAVMLFAETMVLDDDRDALFDFLVSHGNDADFVTVVYNALWRCHVGETNLPLARLSDSSPSTNSTDSSSTENSSSPVTDSAMGTETTD